MLTENRPCRDCGNPFEATLSRGCWPARCPSCQDVHQRRPSVVMERTCLYGPTVCIIESLPGDWREWTAKPGDTPCYRIDAKGRMYGASWSGRVDLRAARPWNIGDIIVLEEIESLHRVKAAYVARTRSDFASGTAVDFTQRIKQHVRYGDGVEEVERHTYVRLSPATRTQEIEACQDLATLPRLVFISAATKTTIKGFGRQYSNELRGAPLWERRMSGGYRSGRAHTDAALALVDGAHPLQVENVFDR